MTSPSITITPARLSFALALASTLAIAWSTVAHITRQDHRLASVETDIGDQKSMTRELVAEIKSLNINVARLSAILEAAARKTSIATETSAQTRGVVETWDYLAPHRGPSSARNGTNFPIFGVAQ